MVVKRASSPRAWLEKYLNNHTLIVTLDKFWEEDCQNEYQMKNCAK